MISVLVATWLGCGGDGRPSAISSSEARSVDLRTLPMTALSIPQDSLGGRPDPARRIPLDRGWTFEKKHRSGALEYRQPVPIRPRGLFFFRATPGVELTTADGAALPYRIGGAGEEAAWSYDREQVRLFLPAGSPEPGPDEYVLDSPLALTREGRLHRRLSGAESDAEFVRTRIAEGIASRDGLLLPAPATATWQVELPPAAELSFDAGLVLPEIAIGEGSDGVGLAISITADGATETVFEEPLSPKFGSRRVNLARWAGRTVSLTMTTTPGASPADDLAFVAAPVIASRVQDSRKVVFVFIDTLRVDHLSLFGYERDTSAAIDHLAGEASLFTNARSVAPWTLPSAQSTLTGRYPDRWHASTTLQRMLGDDGYATGFIAGNVYLTQNFGMERDWDYHQEDGLFPSAESTTDDALAFLDAHDGHDVFLQVHYMSAHLPYTEPMSYRYRYAGAAPDELADGFELADVRKAGAASNPELQQYIRDRYDNNIRYATDQVQRVLERLDDNDILVLYADHGEEFWEHKGYEHGHTLFDELLRVPLVIRAEGMPAGRFDQKTSLLDVVPTVLDLLGKPLPANLEGRSLKGGAGVERPLGFGWPLYGPERWGVVTGDDKWTATEGREAWFDLAEDPEERKNKLARSQEDLGAPFRQKLGEALERTVDVGFRMSNTAWKGGRRAPPLWALCTVPGGVAATWVGDDPLDNMHATARRVSHTEAVGLLADYQITGHEVAEDATAVELCWYGGYPGPRELYFVPERPLSESAPGVICSAYQGDAAGGTRGTMRVPADRKVLGPSRAPLATLRFDGERSLNMQYGIAPAPTAETEALDGRDPEADAMLSKLGYVDKDVTDKRGRPCEPSKVPLDPK